MNLFGPWRGKYSGDGIESCQPIVRDYASDVAVRSDHHQRVAGDAVDAG